jgi:hypothetical protein
MGDSKGKIISCPKLEDRETLLRTLSRVHVGIISTKAVKGGMPSPFFIL